MENNVDLELSFNDWRISRQKTLKEPRKAYFDSFPEQYKQRCKVRLKFWYLYNYMFLE